MCIKGRIVVVAVLENPNSSNITFSLMLRAYIVQYVSSYADKNMTRLPFTVKTDVITTWTLSESIHIDSWCPQKHV